MIGKLVFEDGSVFEGESFGALRSGAGEIVFATGMVGYPESLTDPSYYGQILILTYPLIGNYGVPPRTQWESNGIRVSGLIVSDYIDTPSHPTSTMTLAKWLTKERVPGLIIKDTRLLAKMLRSKGTMLGKIVFANDIPFYDPNEENVVANVSTNTIVDEGVGEKTVLLIDCGAKANIRRCLLKRGVRVVTVPWDYDPFSQNRFFDALVVSNGPGDPKRAVRTIQTIEEALKRSIPLFGICLGHQLLALAAGGDTTKLLFGHRSQNQPCIMEGSKRCFITTQNHGFAVSTIPDGFAPWFTNANDGSNEGLIHATLPTMSVQFHPEASPGPTDTEWIFDYFLDRTAKNES